NRPINILCRVSLFLSMALCLLLRLFVFRLLRLKRFSTLTLKVLNLFSRSRRKTNKSKSKHSAMRSEERFSRNAETDLACRLLLEKKKTRSGTPPQRELGRCPGHRRADRQRLSRATLRERRRLATRRATR